MCRQGTRAQSPPGTRRCIVLNGIVAFPVMAPSSRLPVATVLERETARDGTRWLPVGLAHATRQHTQHHPHWRLLVGSLGPFRSWFRHRHVENTNVVCPTSLSGEAPCKAQPAVSTRVATGKMSDGRWRPLRNTSLPLAREAPGVCLGVWFAVQPVQPVMPSVRRQRRRCVTPSLTRASQTNAQQFATEQHSDWLRKTSSQVLFFARDLHLANGTGATKGFVARRSSRIRE